MREPFHHRQRTCSSMVRTRRRVKLFSVAILWIFLITVRTFKACDNDWSWLGSVDRVNYITFKSGMLCCVFNLERCWNLAPSQRVNFLCAAEFSGRPYRVEPSGAETCTCVCMRVCLFNPPRNTSHSLEISCRPEMRSLVCLCPMWGQVEEVQNAA